MFIRLTVPKSETFARIKPLSENKVELRIVMSKETLQKVERVVELISQKNRRNSSYAEALDTAAAEFLQRHDPVAKAERALSKLCKTELEDREMSSNQTQTNSNMRPTVRRRRQPISAEVKHQVFARDRGRCTHIGADGDRCASARWLHIHHIRPVHLGGNNDLRNLTTLCSVHHDLAHQLNFPIDGQVTWLRAPTVAYG